MGVSALQFKIIKRAVKTRLANGESFEEIIACYPKLSQEQVAELKAEYGITEESSDEEGSVQ